MNTSYAAALGAEDFALALAVAETGLRAHPLDGMLHNNAAYAAANLGDTTAARAHLQLIATPDDVSEFNVVQATSGLVSFREGRIEEGRRLYGAAVDGFIQLGRPEMVTAAVALWAMEESHFDPIGAQELARAAHRVGDRLQTVDAHMLLVRMDERLQQRTTFNTSRQIIG